MGCQKVAGASKTTRVNFELRISNFGLKTGRTLVHEAPAKRVPDSSRCVDDHRTVCSGEDDRCSSGALLPMRWHSVVHSAESPPATWMGGYLTAVRLNPGTMKNSGSRAPGEQTIFDTRCSMLLLHSPCLFLHEPCNLHPSPLLLHHHHHPPLHPVPRNKCVPVHPGRQGPCVDLEGTPPHR